MSSNAEDKTTSSILSTSDLSGDDGFIDDYSHLRLSYYQESLEDSVTSAFGIHYDPNLTESDVNTTCVTTAFENIREQERRKLREYHISQIPDLPPPTFTVASIVSSLSSKMNSGNQTFKYQQHIEHGINSKGNESNTENTFAPNRRSTLNPQAGK